MRKVRGSNPLEPTMKVNPKEKCLPIFFKNFIGGMGWAAGATVGFALLIYLFGLLFNRIGGLPIIGNFFAELIKITNKALETKKVLP